MSTGKVDFDMLFRSFNNTSTEEEERMICEWLKDSESNRKSYSDARDLHEAFIMEAPLGILDGSVAPVQHRRGKVFRHVLQTAGIAAAFLLICILGYGIIDRRFEQRLAETMNTIYVPAGRSMDYTLQDGTVVRLNSGARLEFPMVFPKDRREVILEGEAYFDVASNREKPFTVKTFAADITVLGTEFNVISDRRNEYFSATLVEGSIRLTGERIPGGEIVMSPDEKAELADGRISVRECDASRDILWTEGILEIGGLDFSSLMERLEMAFGVRIVVEDEMPGGPVFANAKLRTSDGIDKALEVVGNGADFTYTRDHKTGTISIRRK